MPSSSISRRSLFPKRLNHLELLVSLVALLVAMSFLSDDHKFQRFLYHILFLAVILAAIRTLSASLIRLIVAVTAGVAAFTVSWFIPNDSRSAALATISDSCYILLFGLLFVALAESVFSEGPVDLNRIIGAISIYLVFGLIWAFVYSLMQVNDMESFALTIPNTQLDMVSEFTYFSFVTLTTLGYGDIAPVTRPARMLSTLEAVTGQLYVAIVIARLVGLQINQRRQGDS